MTRRLDALAAKVNELVRRARPSQRRTPISGTRYPSCWPPGPAERLPGLPGALPATRDRAAHLSESKRLLEGTVSRRVIGKAIGAAAVGVVGAAALVDLHSHSAAATSDAIMQADVTAEDPAAESWPQRLVPASSSARRRAPQLSSPGRTQAPVRAQGSTSGRAAGYSPGGRASPSHSRKGLDASRLRPARRATCMSTRTGRLSSAPRRSRSAGKNSAELASNGERRAAALRET